MRLVKICGAFFPMVIFCLLQASQEPSPCSPIANYGWGLFSTFVDSSVPLPTSGQITINKQLASETAQAKHMIPVAQQKLTHAISLTYAHNAQCFQPQGNALFGNTNVATLFNSMVEAVRSTGAFVASNKPGTSKFVALFRKLQYQMLNDLYIYLTGLYANFILTIAPVDSKDPTAMDLYRSYADLDETQDLSNKALIVCHLINLIQGQMYNICNTANPMIPTSLTVRTGCILLENDQSIDPMFLLLDLNRPFFKNDNPKSELHATFNKIQKNYMSTLGHVLNFFKGYTSYVTSDFATFLTFSRSIRDVVSNNPFNLKIQSLKKRYTTELKHKEYAQLWRGGNQINPPLLYFDAEMIRSLQIVPTLARALKSESKLVEWPDQIVKLALRKQLAQTNDGSALPFYVATKEDGRLFLNIASPRGVPYMQELIKQPTWLNSTQGVLNMVRACLGDFSQLVGLGILEPEREFMVAKSLGMSVATNVQNKTKDKLAMIYRAQAQYEQDQCNNRETCCLMANAIAGTDKEVCDAADQACVLAASAQKKCTKQTKDNDEDCKAAKEAQDKCNRFMKACSAKKACTQCSNQKK